MSDIPTEEEICSLGELYSYTLTHDGLRIFAALSSAFRLPIHGADASCGYQQARQLEAKPIYVHKPSHANYYDLTMEQLTETRMAPRNIQGRRHTRGQGDLPQAKEK